MKFWRVFMDTYQTMYFILFNAITNAIEAQSRGNYEMAVNILISAQQNSEEIFVELNEAPK